MKVFGFQAVGTSPSLQRFTARSARSRALDAALLLAGLLGSGTVALAQNSPARIMTSRGEATVLVEPYAPNIVRVSLSLLKDSALAGPGYGITALPAAAGWNSQSGDAGDVLHSGDLTVTVAPQGPTYKPTGTGADIAKFFNGSTSYVGLNIKTADGKTLLQMNG